MERSVRGLNDLGQAMNTEYRGVAYLRQRCSSPGRHRPDR